MQSVSSSTRTKRVSAGVAAACASALTVGLVSGPADASPIPASSAKTVTISKAGFKYKCKALNPIVNQAMGGPQQFLVDGRGEFSGKFKPGTRIRTKDIKLTLVMPKKLVRKVRRKLGVRKVRGSADVKFNLKHNKGVDKMKVTGLRSGWKKLPRNKKLRIPTHGDADPYKIPRGVKKLKLLAPKTFMIHARLRPPALGSVKKVDLRCKFNGKTRLLGKFPV